MAQRRKLISNCDRCDLEVVRLYGVNAAGTDIPTGLPHQWLETKVQYQAKDLCPECINEMRDHFMKEVIR